MCVKKDNCCSLLCMRTKVKYYIYLIFEVSQITCMGLLLFVRAVHEPPLRGGVLIFTVPSGLIVRWSFCLMEKKSFSDRTTIGTGL